MRLRRDRNGGSCTDETAAPQAPSGCEQPRGFSTRSERALDDGLAAGRTDRAGPGDGPDVSDIDSTIRGVHGPGKHGATRRLPSVGCQALSWVVIVDASERAEAHAGLLAQAPPPWDFRAKGLTRGNGACGVLPYPAFWNGAWNAPGRNRRPERKPLRILSGHR